MIIQEELAMIQNATAKLCANSERIFRVRQDIKKATDKVGMIMAIANDFQVMHQLRSLMIQNTICKFSILR